MQEVVATEVDLIIEEKWRWLLLGGSLVADVVGRPCELWSEDVSGGGLLEWLLPHVVLLLLLIHHLCAPVKFKFEIIINKSKKIAFMGFWGFGVLGFLVRNPKLVRQESLLIFQIG